MITAVNERTMEFRGLSDERADLPTRASNPLLGNGSVYLEMDTSKVFLYDASKDKWIELGGTLELPITNN